jgi:hypothetical protein
VIEYKGIQWYYYQGALLPRVPPHYEIFLTQKEQKELLKISKALFLRYTNEWDRDGGEFWYVIKDEKEELQSYKSKIRNQIKRGLKNCVVRKVTKEIIAQDGYEVYFNAFKNYETNLIPLKISDFKNNILNSIDDFWAVYTLNNKMIGYSQNFLIDESCNYGTMKFHPDYLNLYPSYALIYYMNEYYLNKQHFLYVSDGARSISHATNIQNFLIQKFAFRKAYCKLNIIYRIDIYLIILILYPLRKFFLKFDNKIMNKINTILLQEKIRRSFE